MVLKGSRFSRTVPGKKNGSSETTLSRERRLSFLRFAMFNPSIVIVPREGSKMRVRMDMSVLLPLEVGYS